MATSGEKDAKSGKNGATSSSKGDTGGSKGANRDSTRACSRCHFETRSLVVRVALVG